MEFLKQKLRELEIHEHIDLFMTLAYASLPVIPRLCPNTYGGIDVDQQKVVDVWLRKLINL